MMNPYGVKADDEGVRPRKSERDLTPFSRLVVQLRKRRGMSQTALAREAGISTGAIGNIETGLRGNTPARDTVLGIGKALQLSEAEMEMLMQAAGHLAPGERLVEKGRPTFHQFVNSDTLLRRDEKEALIRQYETYTRGLRRGH